MHERIRRSRGWRCAWGAWDIGSGVQVVAYDEGNGAFSARLWWLLRRLGHDAVAVFDGGVRACVPGAAYS